MGVGARQRRRKYGLEREKKRDGKDCGKGASDRGADGGPAAARETGHGVDSGARHDR